MVPEPMGIPYIAMEYVQGTTLEQILTERGKLPWADVVRLGIEICSALQYAHQSGAIHGDLRPSNLVVSEQGRITLTDFRVTEAPEAPPPTSVGPMLAKTGYSAPEQIRGTTETGPKTDLYALGAVLYLMLTGEVPFQGTAAAIPAKHYLAESPPPPRTKVANIPAALDDLVIKLMAKDPADRPRDAATVGMALTELWERIGRGEPILMANPQPESLTLCIQRLRSPDRRERDEAARVIWERFSPRLRALVRRHLDNRIRRREDEQDILQSVYASFCSDSSKGRPSPASREELWKLLVRITMCKVVNTAHRHHAARRDVRRERTEAFDHARAGLALPALDARARRPVSAQPGGKDHRSRRG